jgi:hypothetical protein
MLFRKSDGTLIEINRKNYKNDQIYYNKIMSAKSFNNQNDQMIYEMNNDFSYTKKILICFLEDALYDCNNQNEDKK